MAVKERNERWVSEPLVLQERTTLEGSTTIYVSEGCGDLRGMGADIQLGLQALDCPIACAVLKVGEVRSLIGLLEIAIKKAEARNTADDRKRPFAKKERESKLRAQRFHKP